MAIVENFAALSAEEQREFAETLLATINTEKTFSDDTKFELTRVEADDLTGGLIVEASIANPIHVGRSATWSCDSADDAEDDPGFEADYEYNLYEDAAKAFKASSTTFDGYKVTFEVADADTGETVEVIVDNISNEDAGIGDYEYWGARGHDSRPYVEVQGTIVKECDCLVVFYVDHEDVAELAPEADEEN